MKVPHVEGLADHSGPESCACVREEVCEALTGESAGRVLSRGSESTSGCRRCRNNRKATRAAPLARGAARLCVVVDPVHAPKPFAREPGGPTTGPGVMVLGSAL